MSSVESDIANAMIEGIESNFKGKSNAEIKELAANSINTLMMSFMMAGDNGVQMLILTLSCCTKITCGAGLSEAKKAAIIDLFEGPIGNLISEQPEIFFVDATEEDYGAINAAASQLKMLIGNSLYEVLFATAYICEPADQSIIDKIKEIYINNNSENLLDQLFGSGMLVADDASAMRKARGQKAKAGPKDANWSSEVLDDGTLEITGYKGKDTTVVIPAEIGGIPVSSLCGHCLSPEKERLKKAQKEVYSKIKKIVVSAGIKMIDGYAFECCEELDEVEFNEGLECFGTRVFNCCEKLKEIVVPDTVTFIGEEAFCCGALEKLQMPNAPVRTMGTISSYNSISEPVYSGDMTKLYFYPRVSKVKEYIIPDGVKIISDGAFNGLSGCEGLEVVRVPEGIEYIGNFTFPGTLKKVYLPNSIREMDFAAFGYDESKPTLCTKNPYVIEYANENGIKVIKE